MNAVMTAVSNENPGSEVFAIAKGALDWLRNAPNPFYPTPIEAKRAEVVDTIRGLARDLRDLDFEIRCADVQIHIATERKKLLHQLVPLYREKRGFVGQIKKLKACITDLNRIKDDPSVLAALAAEAEVSAVN